MSEDPIRVTVLMPRKLHARLRKRVGDYGLSTLIVRVLRQWTSGQLVLRKPRERKR